MPKRAVACIVLLVATLVAALFVWEVVAIPRDLDRPEIGDAGIRAYVVPTGRLDDEDDKPRIFGDPMSWGDYSREIREKSGRDLAVPGYGVMFFAGHDVVARYVPTGEEEERLLLSAGGTEDGAVVVELAESTDTFREEGTMSTGGGVVVVAEIPNDVQERFLRVRLPGEEDETGTKSENGGNA